MKNLGIIADDLTGSLDTGVQFSKWGISCLVGLQDSALPDVTCAIMNTDSRTMPPEAAARKVQGVAALLRERVVYKKIDSTLRGNLGAELLAAMRGLGAVKGIVAPAFPANGRTVLAGRLFVHGLSLERTGFANDPLNAVTESHIPTLLQQQTGQPAGLVELDVVERGANAIHEAIAHRSERIIVVDGENRKHLADIAQAIIRTDGAWLPAGSAGLAEALPGALGLSLPENVVRPGFMPTGPVLVVAGSRNDITAAQVRELADTLAIPLLTPDLQRWFQQTAGQDETDRIVEAVGRCLTAGKGAIVTTCSAPLLQGTSRAIAVSLGQLTLRIMDSYPVGALLLTGGDIALQVCLALEGLALRPVSEVLPGLPVSQLYGGRWDGLPIITKAGGFGEKSALVVGYHYLANGSRDEQ